MGKVTTIRDARRARTLTQRDMARLLGVTQASYWRWETGRLIPDRGTKIRIATILAERVEDLWPEAVTA